MKVLVTCPPMLRMKDHFLPIFEGNGWEAICPNVVQTLSEEELCELVATVDGWIIGDDPATERVFRKGASGKLRAAVKWGIGTDNVDFSACEELDIPITNTPMMFGEEVADIALGYVIGLARQTFRIDREIRVGQWPKFRGTSLRGKTVGVLGYGDIGSHTVSRLRACGMHTIVWDPGIKSVDDDEVHLVEWPGRLGECEFLVLTCSLNESNYHIVNTNSISRMKDGVRIVNVARGPLIDESALALAIDSGKIHSVALDVFEVEPLPAQSKLRGHSNCIFGSHNSSNTDEAVKRTNEVAIKHLESFLGRNT